MHAATIKIRSPSIAKKIFCMPISLHRCEILEADMKNCIPIHSSDVLLIYNILDDLNLCLGSCRAVVADRNYTWPR